MFFFSTGPTNFSKYLGPVRRFIIQSSSYFLNEQMRQDEEIDDMSNKKQKKGTI